MVGKVGMVHGKEGIMRRLAQGPGPPDILHCVVFLYFLIFCPAGIILLYYSCAKPYVVLYCDQLQYVLFKCSLMGRMFNQLEAHGLDAP